MPEIENIPIPMERIEAFCRRWGVKEFALFGSVLRDDFRPDSDVDVLVEFQPGSGFTFENTPVILDELESILGRTVDVVEKGRIRNRFREASILSSHRVLYAA